MKWMDGWKLGGWLRVLSCVGVLFFFLFSSSLLLLHEVSNAPGVEAS